MSSSLRTKFTIDIGGQPYQFAQPFVGTFLELEQDPMQYMVEVPINDTNTIWNGAPAFATLDFIALMADRDVTLTITVDGSTTFNLFLRGGGFPVVLHGTSISTEITIITATNADTSFPAFVSVCVAQEVQ